MPVPEWEDPEVRAEVPAREPDAREEPVPAPREERLSTAMPSLAPREELKAALKTADALPGEHSAEPQEPAELQEVQEVQEPEAVEARASPGKADARRSGKGKAKSKPGHRKSVDAARGTQSAMAAEDRLLS